MSVWFKSKILIDALFSLGLRREAGRSKKKKKPNEVTGFKIDKHQTEGKKVTNKF